MSLPEETGKIAVSAIEAFKGNPACLATILLAAMFAVLSYFAMQKADQRNYEARMAILERCIPINHEKN